VSAGAAAHLRRWLDGDEARGAEAALIAELHRARPARAQPHGTTVCFLDRPGLPPRRIAELDRHGTLLAALRWSAAGLAAAWVRIPDRSWLRIEPAATRDTPWGLADRLWHSARLDDRGRALTVVEALDYARIDRIPTLAEPARLPPGGGVALLNTLAALAEDQGATTLVYPGPYPGEQLFLALLESFRYEPATDPLAAFVAGELRWRPAPHERVFAADDLYVQLRGRVEKVVWRQRTYYRPDWQAVARLAPARVRDVDRATVGCSLWALGAVLEDHLELTLAGDLQRVVAPPAAPRPARPLPAAVAGGVLAVVAARSAAALAPALRAAALRLEWAEVPGELGRLEGDCGRLAHALRDRYLDLAAQAATPAARTGLALAVLTEIAGVLGDPLRSAAQARVAALPEPEQRALLTGPPPADPAEAATIAAAVAALLTDRGE
jgi:hypothetical protein